MAQSYATRHPGQPDKMILISTAAKMDFRAELQKITCPVLVLAGGTDPIALIRFSKDIVRHLPEGLATFMRFATCRHGGIGDQPQDMFRAIRRFLQGDPATSLDVQGGAP